MQSYRQKYLRYKKEVDDIMGRKLGAWGHIKAAFSPNDSFTTARKNAIDQAEQNRLNAVTQDQKADRLYQAHNLIGTTGTVHAQKSRYYRTSSGTFGHITPFHSPHNVGREKARKYPNYNMRNHNGQLQERRGNHVFHTSRNPFVKVTGSTARTNEHNQVQHITYIKHHGRSAHTAYRHNPQPNVRIRNSAHYVQG